MRRGVAEAWCRRAAAAALILAAVSRGVPAAAQQKPPDTTKTRIEIIQERLRNLRGLVVDTAAARDSAAADSAAADTLQRPPEVRPAPPLSGMARDSIMEILAALSGYSLTEYASDSAYFRADSSRLILRGKAQVQREGQQIVADSSIVFDQKTSIACATGVPTVTGGDLERPLRADSLCYNVDRGVGVGYGVATEASQSGANWIVYSDQSFMVGDTLYSHDGIFTDCTNEEPHYHFAAKEMKYIGRDVIVARNVTFNFRDVPVFWLPFFATSTKQGRRSGILTPQFGINDIVRQNAGYQRRISNVGFYWAISDHYGAEAAMGWHSANFTELRGTLEFRYLRQFLAGSMTYRHMWKSEGGTERTISAATDWQPDERTTLRADISYASSTQFLRERSLDPRELNQAIRSGAAFSRRFDWANLNISGSRNQYIHDGTVELNVPVSLTFPSLTLFPALPGEGGPFNNITWNGSARVSRASKSISAENPNRAARSNTRIDGSANSSFTIGQFGISQSLSFQDVSQPVRTFPDTSLVLPATGERSLNWNASLSFQQRLIGTSTFMPGISFSGTMIQNDTLGSDFIAAPTRMNFNASLRTDLFGFFPGIGPLQQIRHRISPSFSYTYSPTPTVSERQRQVFRLPDIREQNRLTIGISQTFEGKPRLSQAELDSLQMQADTSSGPRRRPRVQPIMLLSINTDAVVWDFVEAERGFGLQTLEVGNNIQSDLLRGLQLSFAHDLFEEQRDSLGELVSRDFKPHLSRLSMAFSINSDSWIARLLGLGTRRGDAEEALPTGEAQPQAPVDSTGAPPVRQTQSAFGLIGTPDRYQPSYGRGRPGAWNATVNYTMFRPRPGEGGLENQMVQLSLGLQPTEQWSVSWSTGYSFTNGEFTDHILTFTRAMHDWDANFDFVKAQNGNFSFQFRVQLRAHPDIKLDYEQRELRAREPRF